MYTVIDSFVGQCSSHGWVRGIDVEGSAVEERPSIGATRSVRGTEGRIDSCKSGFTYTLIDVDLHKHTAHKFNTITDDEKSV